MDTTDPTEPSQPAQHRELTQPPDPSEPAQSAEGAEGNRPAPRADDDGPVTEGIEHLKACEVRLRELLARVVAKGDYNAVEALNLMARGVGDLAETARKMDRLAWARSKEGRAATGDPAALWADKDAGVAQEGVYPKYFVSDFYLVKFAWSQKEEMQIST